MFLAPRCVFVFIGRTNGLLFKSFRCCFLFSRRACSLLQTRSFYWRTSNERQPSFFQLAHCGSFLSTMWIRDSPKVRLRSMLAFLFFLLVAVGDYEDGCYCSDCVSNLTAFCLILSARAASSLLSWNKLRCSRPTGSARAWAKIII